MEARSCYIIILFLILSSNSNCHKSNMTSGFDIRDKHHTIARYVAVLLFIVFLLYGVISNLMMAISFCGRGNIYSHAFILISLQLIISNFAYFLPDIAIVLPEILQSKNISEAHIWVNHIFTILENFAIFSALHFTFLLTLNRFVALILPKYNAFFESVKLYFLLAFTWLSVFGVSAANIYYCTTTYNISNLQWKKNCTKQSKEIGNIFLKLCYGWMTFLPVVMLVLYIAMFYNIRHKRRSISDINQRKEISRMYTGCMPNTTNIGSYERNMLIQAVLICSALETTILIYNFLPIFASQIFGHKSTVPFGIFINCYTIFNRCILPTIYFTYNKRAREDVKYLFLRFSLRFSIRKATALIQTY